MRSHVRSQCRTPRKGLLAHGILAFIRSLASMGPPMSRQTTRVAKGPCTSWVLAYMRFFTSMHTEVDMQRGALGGSGENK